MTDATLAPVLRERLQNYADTKSVEAYDALVQEAARNLATYPGACSYLLCCPALNKKSSEQIFKRSIPDRVLKTVYKAKAADFQTYIHPQDFHSEREFQQFNALMMYQGLENEFISVALALYAVTYRTPVLRTPQLSSGLFGKLRSLRETYAGGNTRAFARDLRRFSRELVEELPPQVRKFLSTTHSHDVKLISDLPLEWLVVDDVPLMFRQTLSRMPLSPGNGLFAHLNACGYDLQIGPAEAQRVLVCNCLSPNDDLFAYPQVFSQGLDKIGVRHSYVECRTVTEYAAALRNQEPYILVHWGHGFYDRRNDRGYLHIRDEATQVWDLDDCAVPPIVLLAACETAAIAETHNTPANAWLGLGTRSVLATYFPVQADLTSILFTRILANLLEAVHGPQQLNTWALVVSKTLILNRYLDFFFGFVEWRKKRRLSPLPANVLLEYTFRWNQQRWSLAERYQRCKELLAEALAHFGAEYAETFRKYLEEETTLPHTMFFSHLGAPETIVLRKERQSSSEENSAALAYWRARRAEVSKTH